LVNKDIKCKACFGGADGSIMRRAVLPSNINWHGLGSSARLVELFVCQDYWWHNTHTHHVIIILAVITQ